MPKENNNERLAAAQSMLERLKVLRDEAKSNNFAMLAYLVDMAVLEAEKLAGSDIGGPDEPTAA